MNWNETNKRRIELRKTGHTEQEINRIVNEEITDDLRMEALRNIRKWP